MLCTFHSMNTSAPKQYHSKYTRISKSLFLNSIKSLRASMAGGTVVSDQGEQNIRIFIETANTMLNSEI